MPDIIVTVVSGETVNLGLAVPGVQGPQGIQGPSGATGPIGLSGVTPTFAIGSVVTTTASGANVTISGGPAYSLNFALPSQSLVLNNQAGTSYTVASGDNGKVVAINNASGTTFIVPSGLPADFSCSVVRTGSGNVTISGASGVSVFSSSPTLRLASRYSVVAVFAFASNQYVATGDLSI